MKPAVPFPLKTLVRQQVSQFAFLGLDINVRKEFRLCFQASTALESNSRPDLMALTRCVFRRSLTYFCRGVFRLEFSQAANGADREAILRRQTLHKEEKVNTK